MSIYCTRCSHRNISLARYCARCGQPVGKPAAMAGSSGLLPLLILLGIALVWAAGPIGGFFDRCRVGPTRLVADRIERHYDLPAAKADALFKLLAPDHVSVLVGRESRSVAIHGTGSQVDVLDRFVELLTRFGEWDAPCLRRSMADLQPTWTDRRVYRLPGKQARALYEILAFQDVPVLVGQHSAGVRIDATPDDQQTLAQLVAILNGER